MSKGFVCLCAYFRVSGEKFSIGLITPIESSSKVYFIQKEVNYFFLKGISKRLFYNFVAHGGILGVGVVRTLGQNVYGRAWRLPGIGTSTDTLTYPVTKMKS